MAKFTVNPSRFDPYKNFKFRVKFGDRLRRRRQQGQRAQAHDRDGRAPRGRRSEQQPQVARAAPSTSRSRWSAASPTTPSSRRGPTRSGTSTTRRRRPTSGRRKSRSRTSAATSPSTCSTRPARRCISYQVFRAWVSEFTAQADLDANANAILIQSIKIEHEGWVRDPSVDGAGRAAVRRRWSVTRAGRSTEPAAGVCRDPLPGGLWLDDEDAPRSAIELRAPAVPTGLRCSTPRRIRPRRRATALLRALSRRRRTDRTRR